MATPSQRIQQNNTCNQKIHSIKNHRKNSQSCRNNIQTRSNKFQIPSMRDGDSSRADSSLSWRDKTHQSENYQITEKTRRGDHRGKQRSTYQYSPVIKTTVQNLNLECVKPQRAGIIIYTVVNGSIYFGLGLDAKTHDLTDFGGHVIYRKDLDVVQGAIREFEEEILEIFDPLTIEDIKLCPVIYDDSNLIIFISVDVDPDDTCRIFNSKYKSITEGDKKYTEPEVCGIAWLSWEDFQHAISNRGILFARVRNFLEKAGDFSYML